ncbi:MAG: hypothetical protein ACRDH0_04995 [Actinomycetota bacterium]
MDRRYRGGVEEFAPEFGRAVTDPGSFGPAKAIANAMLAWGVDLTDRGAVDAWIAEFNARPDEERDLLLGTFPLPGDRGEERSPPGARASFRIRA